jgi:phenylacetate-CoA ligase
MKTSLVREILGVRRAERLTPEHLRTLQNKRFKKLLVHLMNHSPFYRSFYHDHGISIGDVEDLHLSDLPNIDKSVMMEHYDDLVCDRALKRAELEKFIQTTSSSSKMYKSKYRIVHTSGSTGTQGVFAYGPDDWDRLTAMLLSRVSGLSRHHKYKSAFLGLTQDHCAGFTAAQEANTSFQFLAISINDPVENIFRQIQAFNPDRISGYASGLYLLAQGQLAGDIDIQPRSLISSGDPLTETIAATIFKAFGIFPRNFYAATESIGMAITCPKQNSLHMFSDWHCFEVAGPDSKPVQPGQTGNLLLTTLYNYTQPLIRYRMNDEVMLSEKLCDCGSPFPVIESFDGRQEELLWFTPRNGIPEFIHPTCFIDFSAPDLIKLQVVQTSNDHFDLLVQLSAPAEQCLPAIRSGVMDILSQKKLQGRVSFTLRPVDHISNDLVTGKYRMILPLKVGLPIVI